MLVRKLLERYSVRPSRRVTDSAAIDHLCQLLARIIQRQAPYVQH